MLAAAFAAPTGSYIQSQKGLPVEIWRYIFDLSRYMSPYYHQSVTISHVCRFWRQIALTCPEIWNYACVPNPAVGDDGTSIEMILNRMGRSKSLVLGFSPGRRQYRLSAYDFTIENPFVWSSRTDMIVGQEQVELSLYDSSDIDALEIEAAVVGRAPTVLITTWKLAHLVCRDIIPALSPSVAIHIRKLELSYTGWQLSSSFKSLLRALHSLEELTLDIQNPAADDELGILGVNLPNLRFITTNIGVLRHNMPSLTSSPHLRGLGLLPTAADIPVSFSKWQRELKGAPRLKANIRHLTIYDRLDTSVYFEDTCIHLLAHLSSVRTLELRGSAINGMLVALNAERNIVSALGEIILRDGHLAGSLLLDFLRGDKIKRPQGGGSFVRRVVLDGCTGITQLECDEITSLVHKLELKG